MFQKEDSFSPRDLKLWFLIALLGMLGAVGTIYMHSQLRSRPVDESSSTIPDSTDPIQPAAVAALGRLEPEGEIINLSAPNSLDGTTTRVEQLLIAEGDWITAGQVVAILDMHERRLADLARAQAAVEIARTELARVEAGARSGDINAQKAEIVRLEAEVANAKLEYERFESLYQSGAVSASERDNNQLIYETAQAQLEQARAALDSIEEVRPVDVEVAQAEVDDATKAVEQAQAELDLTYVRASRDGQVLNIHTKPGETISERGILDLGQTRQMTVVAEVYETDIPQVRIGQKATITSPVIPNELQGEVSQIGLQVDPQEIFTVDPTVNTDNKVIEVRIRLDEASSQQVSDLSNLQVQVVLQG